MNEKIIEIANNFDFKGSLDTITENNQGNINKTYILIYKDKNKSNKYLLQKINSNVFKNPYLVMKNIELITNHITNKLKKMKDTTHKTLTIIKTKDEKIIKELIHKFNENSKNYNNFKISKKIIKIIIKIKKI